MEDVTNYIGKKCEVSPQHRESIPLIYGGYCMERYLKSQAALGMDEFVSILAQTNQVLQSGLVWGIRLSRSEKRGLLSPKVITECWQFVCQACIAGPPLTTQCKVNDLYKAYCSWAKPQKIAGLKRFIKEVRNLGFDVRRKATGPIVLGLCLKQLWQTITEEMPDIPQEEEEDQAGEEEGDEEGPASDTTSGEAAAGAGAASAAVV